MIQNKCYKAGFIESWGRGWQKICNGIEAAGLPKPTIESAQGGVLVTFQRNNVNLKANGQNKGEDVEKGSQKNVADNVAEELSERQRIIVTLIERYVAQDVAVNTKYLSEQLGLNRKTIQRDLAVLQERKLIQWIGSDKMGHWEIIKHE